MSAEKSEKELREIFERYSWVQHGRRCELGLIPDGSGLRTMLERHKRSAEAWLRDVRTKHTPRMYPVHFDYVENPHMKETRGQTERFSSKRDGNFSQHSVAGRPTLGL